MKSSLLGTVGMLALAVAAPASAADLAVKAPPPVEAVYNWTGFYVGINGTDIQADNHWNYLGPNAPAGDDLGQNFNGLFGGAQIGFNYQVGSWVFGADLQGDWGQSHGSSVSQVFANQSNHALIDAFGLLGGRVGYAFNNALLYAKGGAGVVHEKFEFGFDDFVSVYNTIGTASETRWGPAAGVGFEMAFTDHVSIAGEYNHVFLGKRDITFTSGDVYRLREDLDVFSVRLNYRFAGR